MCSRLPTLSSSSGLWAVHAASGDEGTRTPDFRLAKAALSQLSYIPVLKFMRSSVTFQNSTTLKHSTPDYALNGPDRIRTCDPCVISTVL